MNLTQTRSDASFTPQSAALGGVATGVHREFALQGLSSAVVASVPTDLELAELAAAAYESSGAPPGWQRLDESALLDAGINPALLENSDNGFRAALFVDEAGHRVLAFAGSNEAQDWLTNLRQGLGLDDGQYEQAVVLARRAQRAFGEDLTIAGHSLGGGLAAVAAIVTDTPAATFNAAGVHEATLERFGIADGAAAIEAAADGQIRHYVVDGEILTAVQEDSLVPGVVLPDGVGHRVELEPADAAGFFERWTTPGRLLRAIELHSMEAVLAGMRAVQ